MSAGKAARVGESQQPDLIVEPDPVSAFQAALAATPRGQPLWVVSTSIVLVKIRRWIRRNGHVREIWQDQGSGRQQPPDPAQVRNGASR